MIPDAATFQYGTKHENGDIQLRKSLKDARWWARTLSSPSPTTGRLHRTVVVARPVGEWLEVEA